MSDRRCPPVMLRVLGEGLASVSGAISLIQGSAGGRGRPGASGRTILAVASAALAAIIWALSIAPGARHRVTRAKRAMVTASVVVGAKGLA